MRRYAGRWRCRRTQLIQLAQAPNFALNPNLPDIATLFNSKNAALVTNVGTLVTPTDEGAVSDDGQCSADESVFASGPAAGVAECFAERVDADGMGGADCGCADYELQPRRDGADDYFGGGGYAVLQWGGEYAGVGEPGESGRGELQRGNDGVCGAAGDGAGAAAVQFGAVAGAGGQYDYEQCV